MHDYLQNMLSSAVAGVVGRVCFHPLDTWKANLQAAGKEGITWNKITRETPLQILRTFYRGLGVSIIGGTPATILYLNSYEISKEYLGAIPIIKSSPFCTYFFGGLTAELVSCVVFVPTDVIKERMQVQGLSQAKMAGIDYYKNSYDALNKILNKEGLRGLYKGYGASMISFGPFSAIYFSTYENLKNTTSAAGDGKNLSFSQNLLCSSTAGAFASWITNPLDLAKLRLQIRRAGGVGAERGGANPLDSTFGQMAHLWRTGGIRIFFKGALVRILFHAPNTAVVVSLISQQSTLSTIGSKITLTLFPVFITICIL